MPEDDPQQDEPNRSEAKARYKQDFDLFVQGEVAEAILRYHEAIDLQHERVGFVRNTRTRTPHGRRVDVGAVTLGSYRPSDCFSAGALSG